MHAALYTPGLGYYSRGGRVVGRMPADGSDFVTAPELSPLFGQALGRQVVQALQATGSSQVFEFGAGSGALAEQILHHGASQIDAYIIVEVSATLQQQQRQRLAPWGSRVQWVSEWPQALHGVVLGNEVLDAMPVSLRVWQQGQWWERGVVPDSGGRGWLWADRPALPPALGASLWQDWPDAYVCELHTHAEAFIRSLADRLTGVAFFLDYGFPEAEYYHPQRHMGTLMCHHQHRSDTQVLELVGEKDITAHVNFTGVALAAQEAGMQVVGYTSQARFLVNCGFLQDLQHADWPARSKAQMLVQEHEMGELFKVLALGRGLEHQPRAQEFLQAPMGFLQGDRTHRL